MVTNGLGKLLLPEAVSQSPLHHFTTSLSHQLPRSPATSITLPMRSAAWRQFVCTATCASSALPASIAAIEDGKVDEAQVAVQTNWRHAAERIAKVIEVAGERGSW